MLWVMSKYTYLQLQFAGRDLPAGYRLRDDDENVGVADIVTSDGRNGWESAYYYRGHNVGATSRFGYRFATKARRVVRTKVGSQTPFAKPLIDPASRELANAENNDCAVRALMVASGLSYRDCHAFWELRANRQRGQGTRVCGALPSRGSREYPELGIRVTCAMHRPYWLATGAENDAELARVMGEKCGSAGVSAPRSSLEGITARSFARGPGRVGNWLVCNNNHAWAIIDGSMVDHSNRDLRRLTEVWLVTKM